nr:site-specific integrase [Leifsonia soli]
MSGRQREKRGFRTRREARLYVAAAEVTIAQTRKQIPPEATVTVGHLSQDWLANREVVLKPSSFAPLRTAWRVYVEPKWGGVPIGAILPSEVETWVRELVQGVANTARIRRTTPERPCSPSVVIRAVGVLAGILDMAVRDGRISRNPARSVTNLPRKRWTPRHRYLTNQEVFRLAQAAPDEPRRTLILTLAYTGIRWGEAVGLRVDDLDLVRRRLVIRRAVTEVEGAMYVDVPKSWQARSVPFPDFLMQPLQTLVNTRDGDELLFKSSAGGILARPDTAQNRHSWWSTAVRDAGLDHLTPHSLRHTAASLAVSAGANVKVLQRMLGHKSAAMTLDTYADLFEDDLDNVAERLNERATAEVDARYLAQLTRTSRKKLIRD